MRVPEEELVVDDEKKLDVPSVAVKSNDELRIDSIRDELTGILLKEFPGNVTIDKDKKTMTLSKNCGFGGNLFCCNNLNKFTKKFVSKVADFLSAHNGNFNGPPGSMITSLSDLFENIYIKKNFFELGCLHIQQEKDLKNRIGPNIRIIEEAQVAGSHSRRKRRASKKSRKSHRRHRRSTRNKKRNTKRHIKRHTKRYRHRK